MQYNEDEIVICIYCGGTLKATGNFVPIARAVKTNSNVLSARKK